MGLRLGQHFLKSGGILKRIVSALDLKGRDFIVEIGPGHGELTKEISGEFERKGIKEYRIVGIEKDRRLVSSISYLVSGVKNIEIIEGDALKILPTLHTNCQLPTTNYKLVGNIPYYITGHLLRVIGDLKYKPSLTALLIQKEVAERICSTPSKMTHSKNPGSSRVGRGMNLLAASVQFWAEPKILFHVKKESFSPPPKVDSALVLLRTKLLVYPPKFYGIKFERVNTNKDGMLIDADKYYKLIKVLFKQPRKTVLNNLLAGGYQKEKIIKVLGEIGISPSNRPQNLSLDDITHISLLL